MKIDLQGLEPRLTPTAHFADAPGIPVVTAYVGDFEVIAAQAGGSDRVAAFDHNGAEVWSVYARANTDRVGSTLGAADLDGDGTPEIVVGTGFGGGPRVDILRLADGAHLDSVWVGDPSSRSGVDAGAIVGLLAPKSAVVGISDPVPPAGVDPGANAINGGYGLLDEWTTTGVGLVFQTTVGPTTEDLQARLYMPQDVWTILADSGKIDPYSVYVGIGSDITKIRKLPNYIEVQVSEPLDPSAIANQVLSKLGV